MTEIGIGARIHVLHQGAALCGQEGVPAAWPKAHSWVAVGNWEKASCATCRKYAQEILAARRDQAAH